MIQTCQKLSTSTILAILLGYLPLLSAQTTLKPVQPQREEPSHIATNTPEKNLFVLANLSLAQRFLDKQEYDQAIQRFRQAIEADQTNPMSKIGLANAYRKSGSVDSAIKLLLPLANQENHPLAMIEMSRIDHELGKFSSSEDWLKKAESIAAQDSKIGLIIGKVLLSRGELTAAMSRFKQVQSDFPEETQSLNQQASLRFNQSKEAFLEAMKAHQQLQQGKSANPWDLYRKTIALNADVVPALNNLAWHLATTKVEAQRDGDQAVRLSQKAVRLSGGKDPGMIETLAAAQAAAGDFESAIKTANSILNNPKAPHIAEHLKLYQKQTALRE
ncbi:MAG: tetratricopeptide repeat protein [Akkermansiaceae bacterium]